MADGALACRGRAGNSTLRLPSVYGQAEPGHFRKDFFPGCHGTRSAGRDFFHMKGKTLKMGPRFTSGERMKSRILCKKKRAQSRSISGRRCSLDWEQDFTQMGGLDPGKGDAGSLGPPIVLFKKCLETPIRKSEKGKLHRPGTGITIKMKNFPSFHP